MYHDSPSSQDCGILAHRKVEPTIPREPACRSHLAISKRAMGIVKVLTDTFIRVIFEQVFII